MSSFIQISDFQGCRRVNKSGRVFLTGHPLSETTRHKIVDLSRQGFRDSQIARKLKLSHNCVGNIMKQFRSTGSILPKYHGRAYSSEVMTPDVIRKIFELRTEIPTMPAWEIRQCLRDESICTLDDLPTVYLVKQLLRKRPELSIPTQPIQNDSYQTPDYDDNSSVNGTAASLLSGLKETNNYSIRNSNTENDSQTERIQLRNQTPTILKRQSENNNSYVKISRTRKMKSTRKYFTPDQRTIFEKEFEHAHYPDAFVYQHLSETMQLEEYRIRAWFAHQRFNLRHKETVDNQEPTHTDCELQTNIVDRQPTAPSSISDDTSKSTISQDYFSIDNQQNLPTSPIENNFRDFLISDESSSSSTCYPLDQNILTPNTMYQSSIFPSKTMSLLSWNRFQ